MAISKSSVWFGLVWFDQNKPSSVDHKSAFYLPHGMSFSVHNAFLLFPEVVCPPPPPRGPSKLCQRTAPPWPPFCTRNVPCHPDSEKINEDKLGDFRVTHKAPLNFEKCFILAL